MRSKNTPWGYHLTERRLHPKELKGVRESFMALQDQKCALCGEPFGTYKVHLDHDHITGHVRGALHGHCNLLVGKLESPLNRKHIDVFLRGVLPYLTSHRNDPNPLLHPKHLTADEKKERIKRRAKRKRDLNKAAKLGRKA